MKKNQKTQRTEAQATTKKGLTAGQKAGIAGVTVGGVFGLAFLGKKAYDHFNAPKFEDYDGFFNEPSTPPESEQTTTPDGAEPEPETEDRSETVETVYDVFKAAKSVDPVYPEEMDDGQLREVYRDAMGVLDNLHARIVERPIKFGVWDHVYDADRFIGNAVERLSGTPYENPLYKLAKGEFKSCGEILFEVFGGVIPVEYPDGRSMKANDLHEVMESLDYQYRRMEADDLMDVAIKESNYKNYVIDLANMLTMLGSSRHIDYDPQDVMPYLRKFADVRDMARASCIELKWNIIPQVDVHHTLNEMIEFGSSEESSEPESTQQEVPEEPAEEETPDDETVNEPSLEPESETITDYEKKALEDAVAKTEILLEKGDVKGAKLQYEKYCGPYANEDTFQNIANFANVWERIKDLVEQEVPADQEEQTTTPAPEPEPEKKRNSDEFLAKVNELQTQFNRVSELMERHDVMGARNVYERYITPIVADPEFVTEDAGVVVPAIVEYRQYIEDCWNKLPKRGASKKRRRH